MNLSFEDLLAPIDDLGEGDALECWRWLTGPDARPLLMTALGDVFVMTQDGRIFMVDTYEGTLKGAGGSYEDWKKQLNQSHNLHNWFTPNLVAELRRRNLMLGRGQCYSPKIPPVMGGAMDADNMEIAPWKAHFHIQGQLHEKVKDLPDGTPISGVDIKWEK